MIGSNYHRNGAGYRDLWTMEHAKDASPVRAVIEARERGLRVAVVTKSLFGKAHTVMAEGGCAAAMRNVNTKDSWQVHFGDTMRGGKFLNNWRMAELHAQEAPDRVWELETYGALFDRTKDGRISQRNFGGHTYPRLAHVGDRTGLEIIRTLQQKIVSLQQEDKAELGDYEARIKVFHECSITELIKDGDRIAGIIDESDLLLHVYGDEKKFQEPVSSAMITDLQIKERIRGAGKAKVSSNHSLRQGNSGGSQVSYDEESSYKTYQTRIGSSANKVNLAFEEALPELKKGLITSIAGLF